MDDFRAILKTINIIEDEVDSLLNRSLKKQRSAAPVTTPTIYEINAMIGCGELYEKMEDAAEARVWPEGEQIPEDYDERMEAHLEDVSDFRAYLSALIHYYLETQGLESYQDSRPSHNYEKFIQELRKEDYEWAGELGDNPGGLSQATGNSESLIWICFLPGRVIYDIQKRVRRELQNSDVRPELVKALSQFPGALNRMVGGELIENKLWIMYERRAQKVLEKTGYEPYIESFDQTFLHEITHDYLKKNTEGPLQTKTVDEAFAQFTDEVYRNGLDFRHSPRSYESYRDRYPKTDPENIWWMVEIIREKAKTLDLEGEEYSIIDWARMSEAKIHNQEIDTRIEFLEFFTPEKVKQQLSDFNSVIENEMKPAIERIKEDYVKSLGFPSKQGMTEGKHRELREVVGSVDVKEDIYRLETVIESPDRVLRNVETQQLGKENAGKIRSLIKDIEIRVVRNNKTLEYEEELVREVLEEEIREIKTVTEDLNMLANELEKLELNERAQRMAEDIRKLNQIVKDLKKIHEE